MENNIPFEVHQNTLQMDILKYVCFQNLKKNQNSEFFCDQDNVKKNQLYNMLSLFTDS